MNATAVATAAAVVEESATDRLKALESETAPLRARVAEIVAEIEAVDEALDAKVPADADLDAEVVARKARLSKKADLDLERGLLAEKLASLESLIEVAKVEALGVEREQFRADILKTIEGLTPAMEELAKDLTGLRERLREGSQRKLGAGIEAQKAISAMAGPLTKVLMALRGAI